MGQLGPQSNELTSGPPELVQHFCLLGKITSAQERCWTINLYGMSISLTYASGEEGGNYFVHMISICHHGLGGGGVSTLWLLQDLIDITKKRMAIRPTTRTQCCVRSVKMSQICELSHR